MKIIRHPFRYSNFNSVYWLIGINILIFAVGLFSKEINFYIQVYLSMIPAAIIQEKWIWTFVTYMFVHADIPHVLFNMFGLFIFGMHVERQIGSKEFLCFYLITGALAGVFSFVLYYLSHRYGVFLMGASGALYGVMLAYAILFPTSVIYIWGIIPLRAPFMVLGYTVLSLFFIVTGRGGNVAHATHLAGFIFGWLYFVIRFGINPWKRLTNRY